MVFIVSTTIFDQTLIHSPVEPTNALNDVQSTTGSMESLILLRDDAWHDLSLKERLGVLQTIANIEKQYLGLPHELIVETADLGDIQIATYRDATHEIQVNVNSLLFDSPQDLVDSICHEAFHAFQHRLIDAYDGADDALKPLRIFRSASIYKEEFNNYADGEDNLLEYMLQECEIDACEYAERSTEDYFDMIRDYLGDSD